MKQFYYWSKDRKERNYHQEQINFFRLFEHFGDNSKLKLFLNVQPINSFVT